MRTPKLISQNVANAVPRSKTPAHISIFNFHYTDPPTVVEENWKLSKPHRRKSRPAFAAGPTKVYRSEAWDFILAGGALFNNLDYSFTVGHEDGTFQRCPRTQPGGGSAALRKQLGILKRFIEGFDFLKMQPVDGEKKSSADTLSVRVLGREGKAYAAYIHRSLKKHWKDKTSLNTGKFENWFKLDVPEGTYALEWIEPTKGRVLQASRLKHAGGELTLRTPVYRTDLALSLRRL